VLCYRLLQNIADFAGKSSKGQKPYIELNGKQYADSTFIIDHLREYFKKTGMEDAMDKKERAAAHAFDRMFDDSLFWYICTLPCIRFGTCCRKMVFFRTQDLHTSMFSDEVMGSDLPLTMRMARPLAPWFFGRTVRARKHMQK
jgi:hypothetical protein